jgi:phage terminase small subunit
MTLRPRQQRFVEEYLIDLDGKHAAIRAGYAASDAADRAYHLLRLPKVAQALKAAMAAREARTGITRARVIEEYARIAFADHRELADWGQKGVTVTDAAAIGDAAAAAVALLADTGEEGETRLSLKTFDKQKALEALAYLVAVQGGGEDETHAGDSAGHAAHD